MQLKREGERPRETKGFPFNPRLAATLALPIIKW